MPTQANIVIVCAPSAGGKTTVIDRLLQELPNAARFISTTTRPPRHTERHGRDYFFVSKEEFLAKKERGDFIETNRYAGNWYGADRTQLDRMLAEHDFIFFPIDVNGRQSFERAGIDHVSIFLKPESLDVLERRLRERGQPAREIRRRLATAEQEMARQDEFDHVVVNRQGHLDDTVKEIASILARH